MDSVLFIVSQTQGHMMKREGVPLRLSLLELGFKYDDDLTL
jgi:hypothetical protein